MLGLAPTWPANGIWPYPLVRLDYVWHSEGLQALSAELGPRLGSDHLPLIVTFDKSF
jgi:endonuclease/exonuclease/phosphatase (EEP) superfamily protein YafD